jgi:hypothetical protein
VQAELERATAQTAADTALKDAISPLITDLGNSLAAASKQVERIEFADTAADQLNYVDLSKHLEELGGKLTGKGNANVASGLATQLAAVQAKLPAAPAAGAPAESEYVVTARQTISQLTVSVSTLRTKQAAYNDRLDKLQALKATYEARKAALEVRVDALLNARDADDSLQKGLVSAVENASFVPHAGYIKGTLKAYAKEADAQMHPSDVLPGFNALLSDPKTKALILQGMRAEVITRLLIKHDATESEAFEGPVEAKAGGDYTIVNEGNNVVPHHHVTDVDVQLSPTVKIKGISSVVAQTINPRNGYFGGVFGGTNYETTFPGEEKKDYNSKFYERGTIDHATGVFTLNANGL